MSNSNRVWCTCAERPWRTPDDAIGWNQWQYTPAPLSTAQSSTAFATMSALPACVGQVVSSSSLSDSPYLDRYFFATAPRKQWSPKPSSDVGAAEGPICSIARGATETARRAAGAARAAPFRDTAPLEKAEAWETRKRSGGGRRDGQARAARIAENDVLSKNSPVFSFPPSHARSVR